MSVLEVKYVSDLEEIANSMGRSPITVPVSDLVVNGSNLTLPGRDDLEIDDLAAEKIAKFFGMPASYLVRGDQDVRAWNFNHKFERTEGFASFYTAGNTLIGLSDPNKQSLPLGAYLSGIVNNFEGSDQVVEFHSDPEYLHVDVVTSAEVEVLGNGSEGRPRVGDITKAGIRVIAYPDLVKPPVVSTYLHRLVCTNGMSIAEPEHKISLRGKSTEEINNEFESIIANLKIGFGSRLDGYAETANIPITGEHSLFLYNMSRERGLGPRITNRVLDLGSALPDDASIYDATQIFTAVANDNVSYRSRLALQGIGGYLAGDTEHALNRCASCQHLFVGFDEV